MVHRYCLGIPLATCALPKGVYYGYFTLLYLPPQQHGTAHHRSAHIDRCQIARVLRAVRLSHHTAAPLSPLDLATLSSRFGAEAIVASHHTSQGSHFTRSKPAPRASSPQSRRGTHTRSAATRDAPRPITPSIPRPKSHRPVHPTSYHPLPSHASRPKGQGARHLSCSHTSISLGAMPRSRSHSSDLVGRNAEIAISLFRSRWARCRDRAGLARSREGRVRERPHRDSQGTRASFACSAGAVPPGRSLA